MERLLIPIRFIDSTREKIYVSFNVARFSIFFAITLHLQNISKMENIPLVFLLITYVIRNWKYLEMVNIAAVSRFPRNMHNLPKTPLLEVKYWSWVSGAEIMSSEYNGFCMKCKTYVPIFLPKLIEMSNGRTRVAGECSSDGCGGRISKIVS